MSINWILGHKPQQYIQREKKHGNIQAKKQTKKIWRARKENTNKESQTGENKAY